MLSIDTLGSSAEITNLILGKFCSVIDLCRLAKTNKSFRQFINNNYPLWLEVASRTTGYDASKYCIPGSHDFFDCMFLLLCPWRSTMRKLQIEVPEIEPLMQLALRSTSPGRLALATKNDMDQITRIQSFPSRPSSNFKSLVTTLPVDYPLPPACSESIDHYVLHFSEDAFHYTYRVHAGAYAVFEIFNEHSDWAQCNGVYFFSDKHELLWHVVVESIIYPEETDLCCRPMEMWLLTSDSVFYFGHHGSVESYDPRARMDPALWHAALGRWQQAIDVLKRLKLGLNTCSMMNSMTVLHYAAMEGEARTVRQLLKANASPHVVDTFGFTPLFYASKFEHSPIVMILCKAMRCRCMNHSTLNNVAHDGRTALHVVSEDVHDREPFEVVSLLLNYKADPNIQDCSGFTPLFRLVYMGCEESVAAMCEHGADPSIRNRNGYTAMHGVFMMANLPTNLPKIFKILIDHDADINARDAKGCTPLLFAAERGVNYKFLLDLGADPTAVNNRGRGLGHI